MARRTSPLAWASALLLALTLAWPSAALAADTTTVAAHDTWTFAAGEPVRDPSPAWSQWLGSCSPISAFFDGQGRYTVVYAGCGSTDWKVHLVRFNTQMQPEYKATIAKSLPMLGGACTDGTYVYLIWGDGDDAGTGTATVLRVGKYDLNGKLLKTISFKGWELGDTSPDDLDWGTRYPFDAGNCSAIVKNGTLVCTYAREMYSGHQSNHVVWVKTSDMTRLNYQEPYTSHSFDQQVVAVSNGFLFADHGDAHNRGFNISRVSSDGATMKMMIPFHFREGANRAYGYNETYARLGSVTEVSAGFVLAATSERKLSLATAPANHDGGHFDPRDLFLQVFDKDFDWADTTCQQLATADRVATGTRPTGSDNEFLLDPGTTDHGVKWLTSYAAPYYADNAKAVGLTNGNVLLLWEKHNADDYEDSFTTWCMIVDAKGNTVQKALKLTGSAALPAFEQPVLRGGYLYWTTSNATATLTIHRLKVGATVQEPALTGLKISPTSLTLVEGQSGKVTATALPAGARTTVRWRSDDYGLSVMDDGTITAVKLGSSRSETLTALSADGKVKASIEVKVIAKLPTPKGVAATSAGSDRIKLTWSRSSAATGYVIYRATGSSSTFTKITSVSGGSTLTYTDRGLTTGRTYRYQVRAYATINGTTINGTKVYSSKSSAVSAAPKPTAPTGVKAGHTSATKVKVSWSAVKGATGYRVYRATSKTGSYTKLADTTGTSYTNTGLTKSKTYYYKVRAWVTVSGTRTYSAQTAAVAVKPAPAAPAGVKVSRAATKATVRWSAVTGATAYQVYRASSSSGSYTRVGETTATSFANTGLSGTKTYYYKVRALRRASTGTNYSSYSAIVRAKP